MCPKWTQKVTNPDKVSLTLYPEKAPRSKPLRTVWDFPDGPEGQRQSRESGVEVVWMD